MILNLQDDFDTNLPNFFDGLLNQSSMVKEKKKAVKKHVCPEQGCPKSISGYTQSHNLKDHMRKKHNSI